MSNWKKSMNYCRGCGRWLTNILHGDCPRGAYGSLTWIDIEHCQIGCSKCGDTWPLEDNVMRCPCGHVQLIEYTDSVVVIEAGDRILATDGDMVYVLRRSGTVVVGQRRYSDCSYEN